MVKPQARRVSFGYRVLVVISYLALAIAAATSLFPLYAMTLASLRTIRDIFKNYWPTNLTLQNYSDLFSTGRDIPISGQVILNFNTPFLRTFLNSLGVGLAYTLLAIILCSMAGFVFAKFRFPGRNLLFLSVLFTMMIPPAVTLIPLFYIMRDIGWIDSYLALVVPLAANAFGVFWMRQYMQSLPSELLDQDRIDGCSSLGLFWRIALPLSRPALGVLAIILFITSWSDFLWPLVVLRSEALYTMPVFLSVVEGAASRLNPLTMAGSVVATLPIIGIFLIFRRQLINGLTLGR